MIRLARILVSPRDVFDEIREKTTYALPFFTILAASLVCLLSVFISYDDLTVSAVQDDGTIARVVSFDNIFHSGIGAVYVWVWDSIWTCCIFLVWTSYYWVAGKLLNVVTSWRNWFGFTCWTAVPAILGSIADALYFELTSIGPVVSFALLPWYYLSFNSDALISVYWIPIPLVWTLYIAVNGFTNWTGKNLKTGLMVVLPSVVVVALLQFVPWMFFSS